jgi:hypothetical protein
VPEIEEISMDQHDRPRRLSQGLAIQQAGEETLIYDETRHLAFCLNRTSSAVWARCDGSQSVSEIAAALQTELAQPVSEDVVSIALAQMAENGLLASTVPSYSVAELTAPGAISRRVMMTRLAYGSAMLLPAIAMIVAPKAAQAYNGCVDCTVDPETPVN